MIGMIDDFGGEKMKYSEILKKQITQYLDMLHEYRERQASFTKASTEARASFGKAMEEGAEAARRELSGYISQQKELKKMKKRLEVLCDEIEGNIDRQIELRMWTEFPKEAKDLFGKDESKADGKALTIEERTASCEKIVVQRYEELTALRVKYAKKFAPIAPTVEEVEKRLSVSIAEEKKKIEEFESKASLRLNEITDETMRGQIESGISLIARLAINSQTFDSEGYADLLRLAALSSGRPECANLAPRLEDASLSVVCNEFFNDTLKKLARLTDLSDAADFLENKLYNTLLTEERFDGFRVKCSQSGYALMPPTEEEAYLFFSEEFLSEAVAAIEGDPDLELPRLAVRLAGDKSAEVHRKALNEFLRLYEETPEERLVTEQRYFQQQLLEEEQRKNRILERQMEEDEERYERERAEARHRERERIEEERWLERVRRRDEQRREEEERRREIEQRKAERLEQNRARNAALREKSERERREVIAMRRQCNTCANAGHCSSYMSRPNCAAYRPR